MSCQTTYTSRVVAGANWAVGLPPLEIDGASRPLTTNDTVTSQIRSRPKDGTLIASGVYDATGAVPKLTFDLTAVEPGEYAWNVRLELSGGDVFLTPWQPITVEPSPTETEA